MPISRRIRELRRHNLLSLEQLEELSGLDRYYLARLEDGEDVPSYDELERLGDAFGVPLRQLFHSDDEPVSTPWLTPRPTLPELAAESTLLQSLFILKETPARPADEPTGAVHGVPRRVAADAGGKSSSNWLPTRIGQVTLFWAALALLLRAQDAFTKSDMLSKLRESLVSELQFLADPRVGLLLAVLAFALLWRSNRRKRSTQPILGQPGQETKSYSVVGVTALPVFLALVCSVSLAAFKWRSPDRAQVAHLAVPVPDPSLAEALERQIQSDGQLSSPLPAESSRSQVRSPKGTAPLVRSLPRLRPELDRENKEAGIVGNQGLVTVSPFDLGPAPPTDASYPSQTVWRFTGSASTVDPPQKKSLDGIDRAHKDKSWQLLAALCEGAIAENPQWLAPYLYAGEAYANLGEVDRAIDRLEYVRRNGADRPDDRLAVEQATQLREFIRRKYGR